MVRGPTSLDERCTCGDRADGTYTTYETYVLRHISPMRPILRPTLIPPIVPPSSSGRYRPQENSLPATVDPRVVDSASWYHC